MSEEETLRDGSGLPEKVKVNFFVISEISSAAYREEDDELRLHQCKKKLINRYKGSKKINIRLSLNDQEKLQFTV